jgi:hypothetical protein
LSAVRDCLFNIVTDLLKALVNNGSVNTPATYVLATIEGRSYLGNGEVNTPGILGNYVFNAIRTIDTWCNDIRAGKSVIFSLINSSH